MHPPSLLKFIVNMQKIAFFHIMSQNESQGNGFNRVTTRILNDVNLWVGFSENFLHIKMTKPHCPSVPTVRLRKNAREFCHLFDQRLQEVMISHQFPLISFINSGRSTSRKKNQI